MAEPNSNGDTLGAGWGNKWIQARGSVIVILVFILITLWVDWLLHQQNLYLFERAETERRLLEQEARLEVSMIRAKQDLIINNISRFCGVTYQGSEEARALETWYLRRKKDLEDQRAAAEAQMAREEMEQKLKRK